MIVGAVSGALVPLEAVNVSCGLNVTGELGAYYIGAWTLQRGGAGSFRGVTLQSQGAPHNQFLSTLDVQGGRWELEHCEVRGALNSVVAVRFNSSLVARRCGIGGWPNGDKHRNAMNGLSGSGTSTMSSYACTIDFCSNVGARYMGNCSGQLFGCLLQHNNIHLAASEFGRVHARLNTMLETDRPLGDDGDSSGEHEYWGLGQPPVHLNLASGALKVVDCGSLVLERNTIFDSWSGSLFHLGSTNADDDVDPRTLQTIQAEPGPDFLERMAQGSLRGWAADEVVTSRAHLAEGFREAGELTTGDILEAQRDPSAAVWTGVREMLAIGRSSTPLSSSACALCAGCFWAAPIIRFPARAVTAVHRGRAN